MYLIIYQDWSKVFPYLIIELLNSHMFYKNTIQLRLQQLTNEMCKKGISAAWHHHTNLN